MVANIDNKLATHSKDFSRHMDLLSSDLILNSLEIEESTTWVIKLICFWRGLFLFFRKNWPIDKFNVVVLQIEPLFISVTEHKRLVDLRSGWLFNH